MSFFESLFSGHPMLWVVLMLAMILVLLVYLRIGHQRERANLDRFCAEHEARRAELCAKRKAEIARRAVLRKEWISQHSPRELYFNTIGGITAVLRPADYARMQEQTARQRIDGFWESESSLILCATTFIFVTKQGRELVDARDCTRENYAGLISCLHAIAERHGIMLKKKDDIFVPYVNETLYSFQMQHDVLYRKEHPSDLDFELVDMQAPNDLLPFFFDEELSRATTAA